MSYVSSQQCSELSSVDPINVNNFLYLERNILSANESDQNSNKEVNTFHAFQKSLAASFVQGNLTHTQGNIILRTLRLLPCLSYLPKDSRTLLNTPREGPIISKVEPGEYLHIGFEKALIKILQKIPSNLIPDVLKVNWSTDGARLNKSGNI